MYNNVLQPPQHYIEERLLLILSLSFPTLLNWWCGGGGRVVYLVVPPPLGLHSYTHHNVGTTIISCSRVAAWKSLFPFNFISVSYTHLRAHETPEHLVCRLLLEKKKKKKKI
eukprot:TRINITY_DN11962_c0_g1_i1.p1 TRINITY_DN11962_c0_g1~~TRINITY_DN11962_c0_g1_i1.p1  ORF type:complete len:112 (-),score=25.69 TRINITY_DN11962_c0_g1_i1:94-429(-)